MAGISLIITAKNAASETLKKVAQDTRDSARDSQAATVGLNNAQTALAQAMNGNLVGAAKSAASAFRNLNTAMGSTAGAATIAGAAGLAIAGLFVKWAKHAWDAKKATEAAYAAAIRGNAEIAGIIEGTPKEQASGKVAEMVKAGDAVGLRAGRDTAFEELRKREVAAYEASSARIKARGEVNKALAEQDAADAVDALRKAKAVYEEYERGIESLREKVAKQKQEESEAATSTAAAVKAAAKEKAAAEREFNDMVDDAFREDKKIQDEKAKDAEDLNAVQIKLLEDLAAKEIELAREVAAEKYSIAEKAAKDAAKASDDAMGAFGVASDMGASKAARQEQRAADKAARRLDAKYQNALEAAARGATGKHITAALAAENAAAMANIMDTKLSNTPPPNESLGGKVDAVKAAIDSLKTEIVSLNIPK